MMRPLLGPERHCPCCLRPAEDMHETCPAPGQLAPGPEDLEAEAAAFNDQVRKVLERQFDVAGSFAWPELSEGESPSRRATATKEAKDLVWSRRFAVRIVDSSNDGVAADAQHRQNRSEEQRIKARGIGGSEFSSTQSSESSHESTAQAESSDNDSDEYFKLESHESHEVSRAETHSCSSES
ncbi:unnamed protein product [Effrenium voratum]|nr:unnamed protein product [Effrenium voratum]